MDEKDPQALWEELLDRFKSGKINRRGLLKAASAAGMTAAALKLLSAWETGTFSGATAYAGPILNKKGAYTVDPVTTALMKQAQKLKLDLVWNRFQNKEKNSKQEPAYATCINCQQGPCRKVNYGTCGIEASGIVSRNLLRETAAGTAAHLGHARRVATILKRMGEEGEEKLTTFSIKDEAKLKRIYEGLFGLSGEGLSPEEMAKAVGEATLEDLTRLDGPPTWLTYKADEGRENKERQEKWKSLGLLPVGGALEVQEGLHMATVGVNGDYSNFILRCARLGLVDGYCGLHAASGIQDVLFGTPGLITARSNLSVINPEEINLAINGHVPLLAEKIVEKAETHNANNPSKRINVVGFCCTGNELLMRHQVGIAGDYLQQELAIVTGVLDAMVVDVQCVMPSLVNVAKNFHTKIITTDPIGKQKSDSSVVKHIEFDPLNPDLTDADIDQVADEIINEAVTNFSNRKADKVFTGLQRPLKPEMEPATLMAGFSTEQIVGALATVAPADPVGLLVSKIASKEIRGVVAVVGCVTPRDVYGYRTVEIIKGLVKENVLVAITGCTAIVAAHHGLLNSDYTGVGSRLKGVLDAVAQANGLTGLPACLHMGS